MNARDDLVSTTDGNRTTNSSSNNGIAHRRPVGKNRQRRPLSSVVCMLLIIIITLSSSYYSVDGFVSVMRHPQQQQQQRRRRRLYLAQPSTPNGGITSYDAATSTASQITTATVTTSNNISVGWEGWCIHQLQQRYEEALRIKCPFFRRRASDVLDAMDMILQFLVIRHKSLPLYELSSRLHSSSMISGSSGGTGNYIQHSTSVIPTTGTDKLYHLPVEDLLAIIIEDWKVTNHKGYYVTGKLSTRIYHDDTLFDGPDPDMPVRGLYKYINAASQLFDTKHTYCELLSIEQTNEVNRHDESTSTTTTAASSTMPTTPVIVAKWKMHGRLRLPWKPVVPEWTGTTRYHIHAQTGLIHQHVESWDISVLQAFVQTLFPRSITKHLYPENDTTGTKTANRRQQERYRTASE